MTGKPAISSLVIAKYSKDNQLHRARIVAFNNGTNQYTAQLIDMGALTIADVTDLYEMDKIFAKLECRAIKCRLDGVTLRSSQSILKRIVEPLFMNDKKVSCKFIEQKGDTFSVDINAKGLNMRGELLRYDKHR